MDGRHITIDEIFGLASMNKWLGKIGLNSQKIVYINSISVAGNF